MNRRGCHTTPGEPCPAGGPTPPPWRARSRGAFGCPPCGRRRAPGATGALPTGRPWQLRDDWEIIASIEAVTPLGRFE